MIVFNMLFTHRISSGTNSFTDTITITKRLYQVTNQPTVESLLVHCPRNSSESVVLSEWISFQVNLHIQNVFSCADVILRY